MVLLTSLWLLRGPYCWILHWTIDRSKCIYQPRTCIRSKLACSIIDWPASIIRFEFSEVHWSSTLPTCSTIYLELTLLTSYHSQTSLLLLYFFGVPHAIHNNLRLNLAMVEQNLTYILLPKKEIWHLPAYQSLTPLTRHFHRFIWLTDWPVITLIGYLPFDRSVTILNLHAWRQYCMLVFFWLYALYCMVKTVTWLLFNLKSSLNYLR